MKFISYKINDSINYGILKDKEVFKLNCDNFNDIIKDYYSNSLKIDSKGIELSSVQLLSPIMNPRSLRDAYAFRQHVEAGRKSRGLEMIKEYDEFPVYYYSNHNAIKGPGEIQVQAIHQKKLDFELEIAVVIGKEGHNISVKQADEYIFGYTIMNDFSARYIQKQEMKLSLGPVKGKDFATSLGPYIITVDELESERITSSNGNRYNLEMKGYHNNKLVSKDNFKNITWTFAQIISRISNGVTIYPGDIIGSGTCSTGCFLELNQTNKTNIWLEDGDKINLEIDLLGSLINTIAYK